MSMNRLLLLIFFYISQAYATDHTVDLVVDYKTVNFGEECRKAFAINNQIPAPTLHFKEGDHVTINVHNRLNEGTSIHWHGLLVPWNMDGVENVSQEPIPPGKTFSYKFTLKQSGTYWYHAHAGFQEQEGMYGGLIIDPVKAPPYSYIKDYVIVLSDWSNTSADQVFDNLKKEGDYYAPEFPIKPSLVHFLKEYSKASAQEQQKLCEDYSMMQEMRMNIYDFSDIAYDAFLMNGHTKCNPWTGGVKVGDRVRLRFIGAGGSTIFRVKIPDTTMEVIHIQGHDVEPYDVEDFTIAPGETMDVLVKIQKDCPYIIYAESSDTLGAAYGALTTHQQQQINYQNVKPFPIPPAVMMGSHHMANHEGMDHGAMQHDTSSMPKESKPSHEHIGSPHHHKREVHTMKKGLGSSHAKMDSQPSPTTGTKYQNLKATFKTNDPHKPVQEIKMELSGYMGRFMWFINGLPEFEAEPILIEPGKRYRLVFTNESMMHHPMHLHGHFLILRNGHGAYDPLLHTIEVPPGATVVADFDADVSGQWFFHCHHLYHMVGGMARVFRYSTFMEDYKKTQTKQKSSPCPLLSEPELVKHPMGHHPHMHQASFLDLGVDPYHNVQKGNLNALVGWDKHKLQFYSEDAEIRKGKVENADLDIFYWHPLSEFWNIKGGANYVYKPSRHPYWQPGVGIEGLFPYFIYTYFRAYLHEESVKFDLQISRDTQLTDKLFLKTGLRGVMATKTVRKDQIAQGLNYIEYIVRPYIVLAPRLALFAEFDFTPSYGKLKKILHEEHEPTSEKVFMLGTSLLF